jgi:hypothetical protein
VPLKSDSFVDILRFGLRRIAARGRLDRFVLQVLTVVGMLVLSALLIVRAGDISKIPEFSKIVVSVLGGLLVTGAFIQTMLRYLKTDSSPSQLPYAELTELRRRLMTVEQTAAGVKPEMQDALVANLKTDIEGYIKADLENIIAKTYAPAIEIFERAKYIHEGTTRIVERLRAEIRALMRRSNLNLVLGTVTTAAAASMLAYVALTARLTTDDWRRLLPAYLFRLSVAAFIQIFAFFFLRLYRTGLSEIKYFQNEITNVESKCLALQFAILSGNETSAKKVVEELAETERNFILKKSETTVELERARLENQNIQELVDTVKAFAPQKKAATK